MCAKFSPTMRQVFGQEHFDTTVVKLALESLCLAQGEAGSEGLCVAGGSGTIVPQVITVM